MADLFSDVAVLLLLVGAVVVVQCYVIRNRAEVSAALTSALGGTLSVTPTSSPSDSSTSPFDASWLTPAWEELRQGQGEIRNLIRGHRHGREYIAFEYHVWVDATGDDDDHWHITSAVAVPLTVDLPELRVDRYITEDRLLSRFGTPTFVVTGNSALDDKVRIKSSSAQFARDFVVDSLADLLLTSGKNVAWRLLNRHVVTLYTSRLPAHRVADDLQVLAQVAQAADRFGTTRYDAARYPQTEIQDAWYEDVSAALTGNPALMRKIGAVLFLASLVLGMSARAWKAAPEWLSVATTPVMFAGCLVGAGLVLMASQSPDRSDTV